MSAMKDDPKAEGAAPAAPPEFVQLVAMEMAFMDGAMVKRGTVFSWPAGRKVPKWAKPAGTKLPEPRNASDLKPKAAQDAMKRKAGQMSGNDLA